MDDIFPLAILFALLKRRLSLLSASRIAAVRDPQDVSLMEAFPVFIMVPGFPVELSICRSRGS